MSSRQEITKLLQHWFQLTQAEAGAIQSAAWPALRQIQSAKGILQKRLTQAGEKWAAENPGQVPDDPRRHPFRAELGRLISLETRNGELLAAQLQRAEAERESLNEAARNLRKVQRSYSTKPQGAWNCYS